MEGVIGMRGDLGAAYSRFSDSMEEVIFVSDFNTMAIDLFGESAVLVVDKSLCRSIWIGYTKGLATSIAIKSCGVAVLIGNCFGLVEDIIEGLG